MIRKILLIIIIPVLTFGQDFIYLNDGAEIEAEIVRNTNNGIICKNVSKKTFILSELHDVLKKEMIGTYNVRLKKMDPDLYHIYRTDYYVETKKCFKEGFGRKAQIKIWKDPNSFPQKHLCFLNYEETGFSDCYKIVNLYKDVIDNAENERVFIPEADIALIIYSDGQYQSYEFERKESTPPNPSTPKKIIPKQNNSKNEVYLFGGLNIPSLVIRGSNEISSATESNIAQYLYNTFQIADMIDAPFDIESGSSVYGKFGYRFGVAYFKKSADINTIYELSFCRRGINTNSHLTDGNIDFSANIDYQYNYLSFAAIKQLLFSSAAGISLDFGGYLDLALIGNYTYYYHELDKSSGRIALQGNESYDVGGIFGFSLNMKKMYYSAKSRWGLVNQGGESGVKYRIFEFILGFKLDP